MTTHTDRPIVTHRHADGTISADVTADPRQPAMDRYNALTATDLDDAARLSLGLRVLFAGSPDAAQAAIDTALGEPQ